MKLEKYVDKNKQKRKVILISISAIVLISISLLLYKTFASFTESAEFPIMNGKVDYFGNSDIYFVFYQGDKQLDEMPQKDNEENLVFEHAECNNGASIEWNGEEWGPIVKNLSKSKTKCSLYFEEKNSMVDLTLTSCDNHITATANKVEGVQITKYEYQIDEGEWFTGSETQEFNDQTVGEHTIKLRVTNDNNEVSKEVKRSITINEQRTIEIYGKQIPIATCNNGLYEVSHDVSEISTDWNQTEYRFAGVNPKNYVKYNNEIWRIIGLVNVKTESGIEKRLKIVRTDGVKDQKDFGNYSWDRDEDLIVPNWTTSKLKDMLNGIYYESGIGECYIGDNGADSAQNTCDFTGNGVVPKGLDDTARNMIDKEVIWNLGGWTDSRITANQFYEKERGTTVYDADSPTEWSSTTEVGEKHNGIGLIYPSDYGYAVGGSVREICIGKNMYAYSSDNCNTNIWLKPSGFSWTLTHLTGRVGRIFRFLDAVPLNTGRVHKAYKAFPTLYLSSNVKIIDGTGDINSPFVLSIE